MLGSAAERQARKPVGKEGPDHPSWLRRLGLARDEVLAKDLGLDAGRYFQDIRRRAEYIMRSPLCSRRERLRAWFTLATVGIGSIQHSITKAGVPRFHGRTAMKLVNRQGKLAKVPAGPQDAARDTGILLPNVSAELTAMAEDGEIRRGSRGGPGSPTRLFFYAQPSANRKSAKTLGNRTEHLSGGDKCSMKYFHINCALSTLYSLNGDQWKCKGKLHLELPSLIEIDKRSLIEKEIEAGVASLIEKTLEHFLPPITTYKDVTTVTTKEKPPYPPQAGGGEFPPPRPTLSDPEFRTRFDKLFRSWKKTGAGRRASRDTCQTMIRDAVRLGVRLDDIESGIAAWAVYWDIKGWQFCKPTLSDMIDNRQWESIPPDPRGGRAAGKNQEAMQILYARQMRKEPRG